MGVRRTKYQLLKSRISRLEAETQELKKYPLLESRISKLEAEAQELKKHLLLLGSRISKLEAEAQELKNGEPVVRVSEENDKNAEVENEILDVDAINGEAPDDSAAARSVGLAHEGSGRTLPRCIIEIIDSDDEFAPGGNLSGNESTPQRIANTVHSDQISLQNETEILKRKHDSSVGQNDDNDGAIVGRNKLQKVIHVHDGSSESQGSKKLKEEHATRNRESEFHSNVSVGGGCDDEDSSISSSSSSNSDGDFSQQIDKKWENEVDVILSLGYDDELCLKAVCALYRQQISLGISPGKLPSSSSRGFNHLNILRATTLAKFLVDGDPQGMLKKSVLQLLEFDRKGLYDCKRIAFDHTEQLLEIYKKKEDPLFLPLS